MTKIWRGLATTVGFCTCAVSALVAVSCTDNDQLNASFSCDTLIVDNLKDSYAVGEMAMLSVHLGSRNGNAAPCPNAKSTLQISTSSPSVVAITAAGQLLALGVGTATVMFGGGTLPRNTRVVHVIAR